MKSSFEASLLDTGSTIKRGYSFLLENAGKTIALITALVVTLVTFTEIGFCDFRTASYMTSVLVMLISAYIIYFSLEDAGEKLGRDSEDYSRSEEKYKSARETLSAGGIGGLREFLSQYTEDELIFRRNSYLFRAGYSKEEYLSYLSGCTVSKKAAKVFKRAKKLKAITLTPKQLLSKERFEHHLELESPEKRKLPKLIIKLIPSTICMIFTVSLMLAAKDGMTREFIIESILKLSALPIIGLRGYAEGYRYAKEELPIWLDTKTRLIEAFLKSKETEELPIKVDNTPALC